MHFPFYPKHEHGCPNVGHCPHLGGAALGTLVLIANTSGKTTTSLHQTIDTERKRYSELLDKYVQLEQERAQAKLELKLERQNKLVPTNREMKKTRRTRTPPKLRASLRSVVHRSVIPVGFDRRLPNAIG